MTTTCFQPPRTSLEDDSAVLFSTSDDSPDESTSHSSSGNLSPPLNQTSFTLTVKNLSYAVSKSSWFTVHKKAAATSINILKSVSFTAKGGEILAVVGPSGTGKSTLLRIVSGQVGPSKEFDPSKSIFLNEYPATSQAHLRKVCGFVAQEDTLFPLLTVRETLDFSARFRLGPSSRARERRGRVESLMHELGLAHVANSFVGDEENRGISGGERKRVSIGVDVINDPPVLLLDEPTSGLDSSSALQVVELLSSMAKVKGRTIVMSIHQPSYRVLQFIDNFLILSRGSVLYTGSLESLELAITGLGFEIPAQLNPLEFSMEIASSLEKSLPTSSVEETTLKNPNPNTTAVLYLPTDKQQARANPRLSEIAILSVRLWKIIRRTKQLLLARTMQALVGGLGLGSVYVKVRQDEGGVAERLGLFAFSLSFLLSSTVEALPIYLQERRVLMKEASKGSYRISSYLIANTLIFFPFLFAVAVLFSGPLYWTVGLNPSAQAFALFVLVVWLIVLMASSLVLLLSIVSPDFIAGNSLICTVLGAFFLFSSYFIPKEFIPKYWLFMYYLSIYRYPLDCLIVNEYWSRRNECLSRADGSAECLLTGRDVLRSRGLDGDGDRFWINVGIMLCFFVFYRLLSWIVLVRKVSKPMML